MKIAKTESFVKGYQKLPKSIQNKADKQFILLCNNLRHPSIRAKKLEGYLDMWEGRINRSYRFIFQIENDIIILVRIGPHDEGLGKK